MKPELSLLTYPPVSEVIEHCKRLLAQAENGELQGLVSFSTTEQRKVFVEDSGTWPPGDVMLAIELHRTKEVQRYLQASGAIQ